jgi:hypothetical protein
MSPSDVFQGGIVISISSVMMAMIRWDIQGIHVERKIQFYKTLLLILLRLLLETAKRQIFRENLAPSLMPLFLNFLEVKRQEEYTKSMKKQRLEYK